MQWLRAPVSLVQAHLRMLPRLRAEESLLAVTRAAIAAGTAKWDRARQQQGEWMREAMGRRRTQATPDAAKAMGLGYATVPVRRTP